MKLPGNPFAFLLATANSAPFSPAPDGHQALDRHRLMAQGAGSSDPGEKKTVRVTRRRRTEPADRQRAEAPHRRRPADQSSAAESRQEAGGAGQSVRPGGLSGGGLPLGSILSLLLSLPKPVLGLLIIIGLCLVVAFFVFGSPDLGSMGDLGELAAPVATTEPYQSFVQESPTKTAVPFVPPAVSTEGQSWLVMLYQDADDKILEQDIYVDLNEAERVGSSDRVHIVAQVDRFRAGYQGDGNWSSTKRFYITQDDDLERVRSQEAADLGEVNMSDGATLVDFVTWAMETFPADRHVLILSDHGMGWPGGWSDPDPGGSGDRSIPLASRLGDELYLMELDQALQEIRARTGLEKFELIGMDACLMGHLEVFDALAPHARYAVASQETEPALGWAYTGFLRALRDKPDMSSAELGYLIVQSYIQEDQRILDEEARAGLLGQGSPLGGLFGLFGQTSAQQMTQQMEQNITLTAVDLEALGALMQDFNQLSHVLQEADQSMVAQARTYAQSFTSVFGSQAPASYIDLGSFVQLLKRESGSSELVQAADRVLASLDQAVIAERHGPKKPGATGLSIYFPNSQLYGSPISGPESYTRIAERFARESLWDDFLAFHYAGRSFDLTDAELVIPEPGTGLRGPGAETIRLSPVTLSDSSAAPGRPVLLSADVSGQNLGHLYLFVGFYDQASNAIFVADTDYLESEPSREIEGVYYPDWGEGDEFTVEFEWEPLIYAINDGVDSVLALLTPQSYGASPEEAIYTVDGIYTYADGGESRYARLYLSDGYLRQVFGFTGQEGTGSPREIIPQTGDRFTILEKWMDLDQSGRVAQVAVQEGGTLTFGDQMFAWEELYAAPGDYIVGFIAEDLDGNRYQSFTQLSVE